MHKDPTFIYGKKQRERENPKATKPKVVKTGGKAPATKTVVNPKSVKSNPKIPGAGSGSTSNPSTSPTRMNQTRMGRPGSSLPYGPTIPKSPKVKSTKTSFSFKKVR